MVILTYTAISVLSDKIRNKFKNMVPFYHIKKRCRYQINRMYTKGNEFTNEKFEMNIIHENVH